MIKEITRNLSKSSFVSTVETFDGYEVEKAFDDDIYSAGWNPKQPTDASIIINLESIYQLQKISFIPYQNRCKNVQISISLTGNDYQVIRNYVSSSESKENIIDLSDKKAKFLKFEVKDTYGSLNILITDVKIFGEKLNAKFLLKDNNKYYTIKNKNLITVAYENTKDFYEKNGFIYKDDIIKYVNNLNNVKLLAYYDNFKENCCLSYYLKKPFRPIDRFNGKIELIRQEEK